MTSEKQSESAWMVCRGYYDAHCHIPDGHRGRAASILNAYRHDRLRVLEANHVALARDMGVGAALGWDDKPAWVRTAVAGIATQRSAFTADYAILTTGAKRVSEVVKRVAAKGADLIKLFVTGSGLQPRPEAIKRTMTTHEIAAASATALELGLPIAAHCHGGAALEDCIEGGVSSIEHGLYLEPSQLGLMCRSNVKLVLTAGVYLRESHGGLARALSMLTDNALMAGVVFDVGTDCPARTIADEMHTLVALGVPSAVVLERATVGYERWDPKEIQRVGGLIFAEDELASSGNPVGTIVATPAVST